MSLSLLSPRCVQNLVKIGSLVFEFIKENLNADRQADKQIFKYTYTYTEEDFI